MHKRLFAVALGLALATGACSDEKGPTAPTDKPNVAPEQPDAAVAANAIGLVFRNVTGTLADGGTFVGTLRITRLSQDAVTGALEASGTLTGVAREVDGTVTRITQAFTDIPLTLLQQGAVCEILELDLGPLHLDVLGLVVDLSEIHLDITAERGPGNLLGNLLCALAGLLDQGLDISGLLAQINAILAGLLG
jgi:hypothetical protein